MAKRTLVDRYKLLRGDPAAVERQADRLMQEGWMPLGQPFASGRVVSVGQYARDTEVLQAMTKIEKS